MGEGGLDLQHPDPPTILNGAALTFYYCPIISAIPALQPIVHDLFVLRSSSKADMLKDLDTQREVVVSMLIRLIHFHQVKSRASGFLF